MKKKLGKIFGIVLMISGPILYMSEGQDQNAILPAALNFILGISILYFARRQKDSVTSNIPVSKEKKLKDSNRENALRIAMSNKANLERFNPDRMLTSKVGLDTENRLIGVKYTRKFEQAIEIDKIASYEFVEDGKTIVGGGLGASVIGGLAFGGVGAVVGAITGKKKDKSKVNKVQIKLNTSDLNNPVMYINFLISPVKRDSFSYSNAIKDADTIVSSLDILLNDLETKTNTDLELL